MKIWYCSKTILANAAIVGLAYWFRRSAFYVDPFWFVGLIAVANIALRTVTRSSVHLRIRKWGTT